MRLEILDWLKESERRVCELADVIQSRQAEAARRSFYRFVDSSPPLRQDHLAGVTPFIRERQIRADLIMPAVPGNGEHFVREFW